MLDPSRSLQYGIGTGVGEAGDRMSDYFIRRADQYSPVIQVSPQAVDIIFIKQGISLAPDSDKPQAELNAIDTPDTQALLQAEMTQANQLFNPTGRQLP